MRKHTLIPLIVSSFALAGFIAAQNNPEPGFVALFNGRDLSGWHKNPVKNGHGTGGSWVVENGVIAGEQDPPGSGNGGVLLSDKTYGDFELIFDVKPDWGIDTGLFLRSNEQGQCFQIMVDYYDGGAIGEIYREGLDGASNKSFSMKGEPNPDGRTLRSISAEPAKGAGSNSAFDVSNWSRIWKINEWNTVRAKVTGNPPHIVTWINGQLVSDYTSDKKFEDKLGEKGHIGLQVHGGKHRWPQGHKVRFRNIRLKEL